MFGVSHHLQTPLAERMRPRDLKDLVGQELFWAPEKPLWRLVEADQFYALIFWGAPGTGKTSLARVIGETSKRELIQLSAVQHGVKEIREALKRSQEIIFAGKRAAILFMDEIHRLSKNQQDVLLPALEEGSIKFIGATTENPSFEVNQAILSRSLVFAFKPLSQSALLSLLNRAYLSFSPQKPPLKEDLLLALADASKGDARRALNLLEAVISVTRPQNQDETAAIGIEDVRDLASALGLRYDKKGDAHYDTISAFIKSIRASKPDAAIYYLARMLAAGEDPVFIARRLLISASEDIGNANPTALLVANAAFDAAHKLGMPEARIPLAQAVTYLASSPKSNRAYLAINQALREVEKMPHAEIPLHLRNPVTDLMKEMGHGAGYIYAHDNPAGAQNLEYLPAALAGRKYYEPSDQGVEVQLKKHLENLRNLKADGQG